MQPRIAISHRTRLLVCLAALCVLVGGSDSLSAVHAPPKALLEADRFAWLGNWKKAKPLYETAEGEANAKDDRKNATAAKIGAIHSRIWSTSSIDLIRLLDQAFMDHPAIDQDPDLKLRWYVAKAQLTEQIDLPESRRCWTEVLALAKQASHKGWERRASGQLGVLQWLIDVDSAGSTQRSRLGSHRRDEFQRPIRGSLLSGKVGTVLRYFRRYQASLNYYRKALTAASLDKESPFPMEIHIARVGTLVQMGSHNPAKRLIDEIMQRADGDLKARSELLIYRAKILSQTNVAEAISSLNESSTISGNNGFLQTQADAEEGVGRDL